ncbi:MAG: O-antigen ligase family protein [Crocinitomicaceae bacterium]|nr:O-antigen ligase family protein [Crocinitomicaceae bacterium]
MKRVMRILEGMSLLFVVTTIFAALFWPSQIPFIFDDLLLPFGLLHLAVVFFQDKRWRWLILLFGAMAFWVLVSDFIANNSFRTGHLGIVLRWVKWPIIIVSLANVKHWSIRKEHVVNFVILLFFGLTIINLILLLNPFQIGESLHMLYSTKLEVLLGNYHEFGGFRLSGTMRNPNNNGVIFALFLLFFLSLDQKKYWAYCLLAFIFIFLTQSRTVLILAIALVGLNMIMNNSRKTNMIMIPAGLIGLVAMLFAFRSTNLMSILSGEAFKSNSWTDRIAHYQIFFDSTSSEKVLGHGVVLDPLAVAGIHFDSEYLSILFQFGIIGMVLLAILTLYLPYLIKKNTGASLFGWILVLFIAGVGVTNFVFLNVEVITLLSLIIGAWVFLQRPYKLDDNSNNQSEQQHI